MYILLMFVAFIVSNGYKEFLFTFMTTVTLPSVPKNVNQLTSSALPIVTTSYRKQVKNEIRESVVLARIVNIIENTDHSTDHGDVFKVLASASDLTIRKKRNGRCTCNFYFRERLKTIENCWLGWIHTHQERSCNFLPQCMEYHKSIWIKKKLQSIVQNLCTLIEWITLISLGMPLWFLLQMLSCWVHSWTIFPLESNGLFSVMFF